MHLAALNIGHPAVLVRHGRQYSTAINRKPVSGPVVLGPSGLEGDRVSDDRVHGGPDKAVCCYPSEHYAHFSARLGVELAVPAFGENFTTAGLVETEVCIGDTFRVGAALVQVTQPRQPCAKLAMKHDTPDLIRWVNETGYTGFYFRVLESGPVAAGDALTLLARPRPGLTIASAMRTRLAKPLDEAAVRWLLAAPELSAAWQRELLRRLTPASAADADE